MTKIDIEKHDVVPTMAAEKVWNALRVLYFMLRKETSRRKLLSDLNLMMKRGKIADKVISNLMTFIHHGHAAGHNNHARAALSMSDTSLHVGSNHFRGFFGCAHLPKTAGDDEAEAVAVDVASFGFDDAAVTATIEAVEAYRVSEVASPMLPGFGKTPLARQLRITDSPFPLKDNGDGGKVDKAAEEFIQKFNRALQKQKSG